MFVSKRMLTLSIVVVWLFTCPLYGYYYVTSILASPEPYDAYARNWGFQTLMFSLFRLPWLVVALLLLITAELIAFDLFTDRRASHVRHN